MKQLIIRGNNAGWGSIFFGIIDHIYWCEKNNVAPYIYLGAETDCYWNNTGNVWELFYYNFPFMGQENIIIVPKYVIIDTNFRNDYCLSQKNRETGEYIFLKYILPNLKKEMVDKINSIKTNLGLIDNEYVALHFRGTDWDEGRGRRRSENYSLDKYIKEVEKVYQEGKKLFVISDNTETIIRLKERFNNVVYYDKALRSATYDGQSVHHHLYRGNPQLVEDLIIETQICSNAHSFIHSEGNVDLMVLLMNANIKSLYIKTI